MQCEECGKDFRPARSWQRFCTTECHDDYWNREKKRNAYADAVAAHEAKMNGHSVPTSKKKVDLVALGLVKPKPPLGMLPLSKKEEDEDQQVA